MQNVPDEALGFTSNDTNNNAMSSRFWVEEEPGYNPKEGLAYNPLFDKHLEGFFTQYAIPERRGREKGDGERERERKRLKRTLLSSLSASRLGTRRST